MLCSIILSLIRRLVGLPNRDRPIRELETEDMAYRRRLAVAEWKRAIVPILCLGLLAAACSGNSGQSAGSSSTRGVTRENFADLDPNNTKPQVWFASMPGGEGVAGPFLFESYRTVPVTSTPGTAAMNALLQGPTAQERSAGLATTVPAGTKLLGLSVANDTATVDLSGEFGSGGGTTSVTMRLAQVVYTLTQFPTVRRVLFEMDGRPVHVFTGEGIILNGPQTREDFADLLPPILVETPGIGENITSPVMGAGTANVFEAAVSIRILDSNSKIIASTTTTATCGSGCRGTFRKRVAFHTASTQDGTIEVFEVSAKNGKPTNIVFIPVTLSP